MVAYLRSNNFGEAYLRRIEEWWISSGRRSMQMKCNMGVHMIGLVLLLQRTWSHILKKCDFE
jgi:hypothetical protein